MIKYRLSNCLIWKSESFSAESLSEFRNYVVDILIDYNTSTIDEDRRHARIYKELKIKYIKKQLSGGPRERYHDSFMGMFAKHAPVEKSILEAHFSIEHDRWYRPSLYNGRTFIRNISDIKSAWNILQRGVEHYKQLCEFCDSISDFVE